MEVRRPLSDVAGWAANGTESEEEIAIGDE